MYEIDRLKRLQKRLEEQYRFYCLGIISEEEYLKRAKPIDQAIGEVEMATLSDTLVLKEAFSLHALKQEH